MLRMLRFEFQKLFSHTIVIGALAVLLLISVILLQSYCFNNSSTTVYLPDGEQLSGREAILYNQSLAEKYAGKAIRTYHQHRFPVGYQRNAGTNQLFGSQRRNDSRHQSTGTGSGQKTRDGERRSTGIYPHGYDQRH